MSSVPRIVGESVKTTLRPTGFEKKEDFLPEIIASLVFEKSVYYYHK